jgi:hypothetical protein
MLSIPDTPEFRQILDSLNLTEEVGDIRICAQTMGQRSNEIFVNYPALYLVSDQSSPIKISALIRKLMASWENTDHPVTEKLAELALGTFTVLKSAYPDALALFNQLLNSVVPVDFSHYVILPAPAKQGVPSQFMGFKLGSLEDLSLSYRSTKAHSDYYKLHARSKSKRYALESPVYQRAVIAFLDLSWFSSSPERIHEERFSQILLSYYEELSREYAEQVWRDLDDKQAVGAAAGFEAFGVPSIKHAPGISEVSVYLNQTKNSWDGYVVPLEKGLQFNSWSGSPPVLKQLESYQKGLNFPYSPTLSQVARFGVKARRASSKGYWAEALLNFTIALEMLFSEKSQTSQNISRRLAVIVCENDPTSYSASKKKVLTLYDSRSKYVHEGDQPDKAIVDEMTSLFERTLALLIRLEKCDMLKDSDKFNIWIKNLDWIASGYEAGHTPPDDTLIAAMLKSPDSLR